MRQLFRIGEMAKLFGMNIRTLRFYDRIGLLCPIYTNPDTRYRYYSTEQFERLNTIRYLRAHMFVLSQILIAPLPSAAGTVSSPTSTCWSTSSSSRQSL